jgi:hypothetical protein
MLPTTMSICGICGTWRSKELGCFKAQLTKGIKRCQEELSHQWSGSNTQQRRQQSRPGLKWWTLSTGNFDTPWLRIDSTQHVHDAIRVASRRNVS